MTKDITAETAALRDWFRNADDAADVKPSAQLYLMHRFATNGGLHGTPEIWSEYLRTTRIREPHLFRDGPYSQEARAAKLKKMRAPQRLDEANRRGGE